MLGRKTGGRKAGTPNKRTQELRVLADGRKISPEKLLLMVIDNDLVGLGLKRPDHNDEEHGYVPDIPLKLRIQAAIEIMPYLFSIPKTSPEEDESDEGGESKMMFVAKDEFNVPKES